MADGDEAGFCVPYTVRIAPDRGRGIFAAAPIRKWTIVWRHVRGQYAVYDEHSLMERLAGLPRSEVVYELTHMFGLPEFPGYVIRVFDDGVRINHSRLANTAMNDHSGGKELRYHGSARDARDVEAALLNDRFALIAIRDLEVGDELTQDYTIGVEDPAYYDALCEQYDVSWSWL